jgi:ClpP class serine protease
MKSNQVIDNFWLHGEFHIELGFAQAELSNYLEEIRLVSLGVPYAELGIATRRKSAMPGLLTFSENGTVKTVSDPSVLQNETATPKGSFAHLKLFGTMRSQDGMSTRGIDSLISDINAAMQNDNIDGILLECNTGGGESTAGQMLQGALADATKPVVAYVHQLCSAGIMGTLSAHEIIASNKSAKLGSIGTFISISKGFADWYKSKVTDVYAEKSANKNKAFRDFLNGDLTELKKDLNLSNEQFLADVQAHRVLTGDQKTIEHTLSGAVFDAKEAKNRGLCDSIGGLQFALKRLSVHARMMKSA